MKKGVFLKVLILLISLVVFSWFLEAKAETCPEKTIVEGNSITFVGGVVDMGGDTKVTVWFEYGTSSGNYTYKTYTKILTQPEKYCIKVENLDPCTTYFYRAAMENQAGKSYGAEQSRTTACGNSPQVLGASIENSTQVSTGFKDTILNSILLPVLASLILTWLFAGHIINFEAWIEKRKKAYENFKAKKILKLKIKKLKKL